MKKLVIILGIPGSGTSAMAHLCQDMGAYLGEKDEWAAYTKYNLDNLYENKEIACINDAILHLCGQEWYSLGAMKADYNCERMMERIRELKVCIQKLLEKADTVVIKEPVISLLLPIWKKALREIGVESQYIWMIRDPLEIAELLKKEAGYSREHSLQLWVHYNLSILQHLEEKDYVRIDYSHILKRDYIFEELGRLFGSKADESLKRRWNYIINQEESYLKDSNDTALNGSNKFAVNLYSALLQNKSLEPSISKWERQYMAELSQTNGRYIDYEALENKSCLKQKEIIIYGAGNFGRKAADMLQQLGEEYNFCDRDAVKQGLNIKGGRVYSIAEVEKKENICIIIAIEREELRKEIEQTLLCIKGVVFLSYFALKKIWTYSLDDATVETRAETYAYYYKRLLKRADNIKKAGESSVWVYQNGKVGSMTVSKSLEAVGIKNAHIHGFFFKNDIVGELVLGNESRDFIKSSNAFWGQLSTYTDSIKMEAKGKKIITMVRDPIAVDLSTIFQWMGAGSTDRYFAQQLKQGKTVVQSLSELMVRMQGRIFRWFDDELRELCGIDVFAHPFDQSRGYTVISENDVDILLLKTEKLSQLTEVIQDFVGNDQIKLENKNMGRDKEYVHIYEESKKRIKLSGDYVKYYYEDNPYMDYFYSEEEKKELFNKWKKCMK